MKRTPSKSTPPTEPTVSAAVTLPRLESDLATATNLLKGIGVTEEEYEQWKLTTLSHLKQAFGDDDDSVFQFKNAGRTGMVITDVYAIGPTPHQEAKERLDKVNDKVVPLRVAINRLKEMMEDEQTSAPKAMPESKLEGKPQTSNVFIVHGHDKEAKLGVARVLEKLGLNAIILGEQENEGNTIVEKFEQHADQASYAVVLATPDDEGKTKGEIELKQRARQNVILELGFFMAKLGRKHVCLLCKKGIELPSDIHGVVYVSMDDGDSWHFQLGKELRKAGFNVSLDSL